MKLTEDQKRAIRTLRERGETYDAIAESIGVSPNTIRSYWRRNGVVQIEPRRPRPGHCRNCGTPLDQTKGARRRTFCSDQCRYDWWNAYRRDQPYRLICQQCGKSFISFGNQKRAFCGRDCYNLSRQQKGVP